VKVVKTDFEGQEVVKRTMLVMGCDVKELEAAAERLNTSLDHYSSGIGKMKIKTGLVKIILTFLKYSACVQGLTSCIVAQAAAVVSHGNGGGQLLRCSLPRVKILSYQPSELWTYLVLNFFVFSRQLGTPFASSFHQDLFICEGLMNLCIQCHL
jgi:hypothetical protein